MYFNLRDLMFLYEEACDTVVSRLRRLPSNQMLVITAKFSIICQILTSSGIGCVSKGDSQHVRHTVQITLETEGDNVQCIFKRK